MFVGHYAVGFMLKKTHRDDLRKKKLAILIVLLCMGFAAMFFAPDAGATPAAASVTSLALYAMFTALAFWCDRKTQRQRVP